MQERVFRVMNHAMEPVLRAALSRSVAVRRKNRLVTAWYFVFSERASGQKSQQ